MAAFAATEYFAYSNGTQINGQSGGSGWAAAWSGVTSVTATTAVPFGANNSATAAGATGGTLVRQMSSTVDSGDAYLALQVAAVSGFPGGYMVWEFNPTSSFSDSLYIELPISGSATNLLIGGSTEQTLITGISPDTWYVVHIQFLSSTTARAQAKVKGGAYGAFSGAITYGGGASNPQYVLMASDKAYAKYWAVLGTTDPDPPAPTTGGNFLSFM